MMKNFLFIIFSLVNLAQSDNDDDYLILGQNKKIMGQHSCKRKCQLGTNPKICKYNFKIENYYTMTKSCHNCPKNLTQCFLNDCIPGDGIKRGVVTVNRQLPGPSIEVCQNDLIIVDVENELMAESTTIHWHGQHMKKTPYMDGVPFVTQCPILPRTTFRYEFQAAQSGTHFWHSHIGMQRVDGCYGPLIVRIPEEEDPLDSVYDFDLSEHILVIIDWEHVTGMEKFLYHHHSSGDNKPLTILINGLGRRAEFFTNSSDLNEIIDEMPLARFSVEQGYRYRFRMINAGFLNCPIQFSIDNHKIKVISSDGEDVKPIEVDSFVSYAGERFDFVLSADQPKNLYWMRFKGLMDCDERYHKAFQVAVLEYEDFNKNDTENLTLENYSTTELSNDVPDLIISKKNYVEQKQIVRNNNNIINIIKENNNHQDFPTSIPTYDNSLRTGKQLNSLNIGTESNSSLHVTIPELSSLKKWDDRLKLKPDYKIFLAYDFYKIDNRHLYGKGYEFENVSVQVLTPQINHISMKTPTFPLLSQRDEIPNNMFCNANTVQGKNCNNKHYCECPHVYEITLNSVVELIIVDEGFAYDANHPLHLHGYNFRVVSMEKIGQNVTVEQVRQRDKKNVIKRNLFDAPIKDTVTVPDGGYTIVRFQASNPGFWIFHCHLEFHAEIGMALIFKIGENKEMLPIPHNFPKCGNYLPAVKNSTDMDKPNCSRNSLINKFEKMLFGDYCMDISGASSGANFFKFYTIHLFILVLSILINT